jgi:hypothetical protein
VLQLLAGITVNTQRACDAFEASGYRWSALAAHPVPPAVREHWPAFTGLMTGLGAESAPWEGQVTRVRGWYEPQLERLYAAFAAAISRLERLAMQCPSREAFVTG